MQVEALAVRLGSVGGVLSTVPHACVLQVWDAEGLVAVLQELLATVTPLPLRQVTVRVWVPVPQVFEHEPQAEVLHEYVGAGAGAEAVQDRLMSGFGCGQRLALVVRPSSLQLTVRVWIPLDEHLPQLPISHWADDVVVVVVVVVEGLRVSSVEVRPRADASCPNEKKRAAASSARALAS